MTTNEPRAKPVAVRTVGVIGTGAMGGGVVACLVRAGIPVIAHDILPDAQARAVSAGARAAHSAAEVATLADAAIILVVDEKQVETVLFGPDGLAGAAPPGFIVVAASTVDPAYPADLAARLAKRDIALLDAPVSGGPARAAAGTMTMMVSGDGNAFARVEPILAQISGRLFALSPRAGDASAFKIVNNLLAGANLAAAAEAMALASALGLDLSKVHDVVCASSGASWIFSDRMPRVVDDDFAPPRAALRLLAKDVGIAAGIAARLGIDAPIAAAALAAYVAAIRAGGDDDDDAIVIRRAIDGIS